MNLSLLNRMAAEVADETLAELLTEAVASFNVADTEQLRQIDVIVSELKKRHGIVIEETTKRKRNYKAEAERRKNKGVSANGGSLREESGKLQSGESGTATPV